MTEERFCHKLGDQPQLIQGPGMLGAGGDEVDAGGFDGTVSQHIRQMRQIFFNGIERPGKQMPQIMGKYLSGLHSRMFA